MGKRRKRTPAQKAADAKRTGRPPKSPGKRRKETLTLRCTTIERRRLEAEAKRQDCTVSELLMRPWREEG